MPRLNQASRETQRASSEQKSASAPTIATVPQKHKPKFGWDAFHELKLEDCKPYTTSEELPQDYVEYQNFTNSDGHLINKRRVAMGEPRCYMEQSAAGRVNLVGKYRNGKGTATRCIRTLKPFKDARGLPRHLVEEIKNDKRIYDQLRAQGIPVFPVRTVG